MRATTVAIAVAAALPALASGQTYRLYSATLSSFGASKAMGEVVVFMSSKRLVAAGTATGLEASIVARDSRKLQLGTAAAGPGAYMMTGSSCGTAASFGYPAQMGQPGTFVDVWQASHSYTTDAQGDSQFSVVVRFVVARAARFDGEAKRAARTRCVRRHCATRSRRVPSHRSPLHCRPLAHALHALSFTG